MARYRKGTVNNNWDRDQDEAGPPMKPTTLIYSGADGAVLKQHTYPNAEIYIAITAYRMAVASLVENPSLLPEGTVKVALMRDDRLISSREIDPERRAA